jgi:hypothetical protein
LGGARRNEQAYPRPGASPYETGSNTLISTTDEDIATKQKWLNATEYDSQTRDEIDALWENVEKKDLWFMLGARVKKQTIISHEDDQWTLVNDKEAEEVCDDNELMTRIHRCGDKVKCGPASRRNETHGLSKEQSDTSGHRSRQRPR